VPARSTREPPPRPPRGRALQRDHTGNTDEAPRSFVALAAFGARRALKDAGFQAQGPAA